MWGDEPVYLLGGIHSLRCARAADEEREHAITVEAHDLAIVATDDADRPVVVALEHLRGGLAAKGVSDVR
jgi:hypothetical protein